MADMAVENPYRFTDDDISSLDESLQRETTPNRGSSVPIAYVGEGEYVFRIWPDRDEDGRIRLAKRVSIHNFAYGADATRIRCAYDNRIHQLANRAQQAGFKDAWRWKPADKGYMMVHVYDCPESPYLRPDSDVCFVLTGRQRDAILKWVTGLSADEKKRVAIPEGVAPAVRLRIRGRGRDEMIEVGFDDPMPMPGRMLLPDGAAFGGLDDVYIRSTDLISEDAFQSFQQYALSLVDQMSEVNVVDVVSGGNGAASPPSGMPTPSWPSPDAGQSAPRPAAEEEKCYIIQLGRRRDEVRIAYEGVRFGYKPVEKNQHCDACPVEAECLAATNAAGRGGWEDPVDF